MPNESRRASTTGEAALFFLLGGLSERVDVRSFGFATADGAPLGPGDVITLLNGAPKPLLCTARVVGATIEISTETLMSPDALRARERYLQLVGDQLTGLGDAPEASEKDVLLKSEHAELVLSSGLLRQFFHEYEVPHSRSQSKEDLATYSEFAAVIRVAPPGTVRVYWGDKSSAEEAEQ